MANSASSSISHLSGLHPPACLSADGLWGVKPPEPSSLPTVLAPTLIPNIPADTQSSSFLVCPQCLQVTGWGAQVTPVPSCVLPWCHAVPPGSSGQAYVPCSLISGTISATQTAGWQEMVLATVCPIFSLFLSISLSNVPIIRLWVSMSVQAETHARQKNTVAIFPLPPRVRDSYLKAWHLYKLCPRIYVCSQIAVQNVSSQRATALGVQQKRRQASQLCGFAIWKNQNTHPTFLKGPNRTLFKSLLKLVYRKTDSRVSSRSQKYLNGPGKGISSVFQRNPAMIKAKKTSLELKKAPNQHRAKILQSKTDCLPLLLFYSFPLFHTQPCEKWLTTPTHLFSICGWYHRYLVVSDVDTQTEQRQGER